MAAANCSGNLVHRLEKLQLESVKLNYYYKSQVSKAEETLKVNELWGEKNCNFLVLPLCCNDKDKANWLTNLRKQRTLINV